MALPNLLFLFTDEQRADTLAAYGNDRIEMPNLNGLADQSVVFEKAYITQPVCTPSRSSILTGQWPHTNGCTANNIPLGEETLCFPEMLSSGDYVTGYHGKWHLGDEIFRQHGFDDWRSIEDVYCRYYRPSRDQARRSTYHHFLIENGFTPKNGERFRRGETARYDERFSKPAYLAGEASRFIRQANGRPFVLFVNFLEPHMPFFGPRDDQYDPQQVTLPKNFDRPPQENQPLKTRLSQIARYHSGHGRVPLKTEADWRRMIANYWGLCSLVDTHVGTILQTLRDCGQWDNTIIVYTSDHGDMMGSHRLIAKCVMFEEATRVPLLVRVPGQTTGKHVSRPVSQIDLAATLLDLMGQAPCEQVQGTSLRPLIENGDAADSDDVFIEWNGPNCDIDQDIHNQTPIREILLKSATTEQMIQATTDPVRTIVTPDGWKLNCSPLGEHELYNLNDDPVETNNLAAKKNFRPLMNDLAGRIRQWQRRAGDQVALPDTIGR